MTESLGDYIDMLDTIEQGYDDEFSWLTDHSFISSIRKQIEDNKPLSDKQKEAIRNIYTKGIK